MIVTNPTDQAITVAIEGQIYTVAANGSTSGIREKHANHWVEQLHNFLIVSPEKAAEPKITLTRVDAPKVADVIEVVKEVKEVKDKK